MIKRIVCSVHLFHIFFRILYRSVKVKLNKLTFTLPGHTATSILRPVEPDSNVGPSSVGTAKATEAGSGWQSPPPN